MPIFEFWCLDCGTIKEMIWKEGEVVLCAKCQTKMTRLLGSPTIQTGQRHLKKGRMPPELKEHNR